MSFGSYNQTLQNPTSHRFRSISNITGAKDVKDLACRVQTALDNLNSQLNSQVAPALANCCAPDPIIWDYKDARMGGGTSPWYVSNHVNSLTKMSDCNWFAFTKGGRIMVMGYDSGLDYYTAWFSLSGPSNAPFTSVTGPGNTSFTVGTYVNWGNSVTDGNWGWIAPNEEFFLDFGSDVVRVRRLSRTMDLVSSASETAGTNFQPRNGFVYDQETGTIWCASQTAKVGYILRFDETTGVISKAPNWSWTNNDKIRAMGWNPFERILVVFSDGGRIRTYSVEDPLNPVELDNHNISADNADFVSGSTVRGTVDCEAGTSVYFHGLNAASTAILAGSYTMDALGQLTVNTNTVETQANTVSTYVGEGFHSSQQIYRYVSNHTGGSPVVHSVDFSDPDTPTVISYSLPNGGGAGADYQFPRFDVLVQYNPDDDGFRTILGLQTTTDETKLKTATIDRLTFNNKGCLIPLEMPNNRLIPNMNAQFLGGYSVGEVQLRKHNAVETWLWES